MVLDFAVVGGCVFLLPQSKETLDFEIVPELSHENSTMDVCPTCQAKVPSALIQSHVLEMHSVTTEQVRTAECVRCGYAFQKSICFLSFALLLEYLCYMEYFRQSKCT